MECETKYYCLCCMQPATADEFTALGEFYCPTCGNERLELQLCDPEAA